MPVIETTPLHELGRKKFPRPAKDPNHKPNCQRIHFGWNAQKVTLELFNDDGRIIKRLHPWNSVTKKTFAGNGLSDGDSLRPWASQYFTDTYGITPSKVAKIAKGILYEQVVKPNPHWAKLCRKGNWLPGASMQEFLEHNDLYEQCAKDRTENIIPLVALFGMDAKGLRELFGKNPWKKIVKNTYSRNRLIFINIMSNAEYIDHGILSRKKRFLYWNEFPSTTLKSRYVKSENAPWWMFEMAFKETKQPLKALLEGMYAPKGCSPTTDIVMEIKDTQRMASRLEQPFDQNWSYRRIKEEHNRLTLLERDRQQILRASRDVTYAERLKINFKDLHKWLDVVRWGDCVGTPLLNMQEVIDEGSKQGHCVGSYADYCAQGGYVVYSLEKNGVKSTLGVTFGKEFRRVVNEDGTATMEPLRQRYIPQQHYLAYNRPVTDSDMLECALEIVRELNERNKIDKTESK